MVNLGGKSYFLIFSEFEQYLVISILSKKMFIFFIECEDGL